MELRIAAEAGFQCCVQHGVSLAGAVDLNEPFHALAISKVRHREPCLLLEQPAEACRAQAGPTSHFVQRKGIFFVTDEPGGPLYGRMHIAHGNPSSSLKALPRVQQRVAQPGVKEARLFVTAGNFRKQLLQPGKVILCHAPAGFALERWPQQCERIGIRRSAFYSFAAEDGNPHLELSGLLNEHVFLRREEPKQIAAPNSIAAIADQVRARSTGDEVEFKLSMRVPAVGAGCIAIAPQGAIERIRNVKTLTHGDKKR